MKKVIIYTKTGDKGTTSLFGGKRLGKDNLRIEAYGTLDELNSALGTAASFVKDRKIIQIIGTIQNNLFEIGAELANPGGIGKNTKQLYLLNQSKIDILENIIDHLDKSLPTLKEFILPAGTSAASLIQLSRSIARRAERRLVTLSKKENVNESILIYLNRLSDLLFVLSRYLNHKAKVKETTWKK